MNNIGIGIIGGGYMGKAHSVAFSSVASVFNTPLRPRLVSICSSTTASAEIYRKAYGFEKATCDWHDLIDDPEVQAIVIASPQATHHDIALAAFAAGKPVLCEKPPMLAPLFNALIALLLSAPKLIAEIFSGELR